jgi:hypothetical protein
VRKAKNSAKLGGTAKRGFGEGVVGGAAFRFPAAGASNYAIQPFGNFDFAQGNADADFGVDAIAPADMKLRDFVGNAEAGFTATESIDFGLAVTPPGGSLATTDLCTVSVSQPTCRADGPVTIPKDSRYRLSLGASTLSGNEAIGWQFREAAG